MLKLVAGKDTEAFKAPGLRLIIELENENEYVKGMKCTNTASIDRTDKGWYKHTIREFSSITARGIKYKQMTRYNPFDLLYEINKHTTFNSHRSTS